MKGGAMLAFGACCVFHLCYRTFQRMSATARDADSASRRSATVLSLCLPSDVLLYLLLPMNADAFGISLA
jgi:hypothetical protein